jgi:hypothetical protein
MGEPITFVPYIHETSEKVDSPRKRKRSEPEPGLDGIRKRSVPEPGPEVIRLLYKVIEVLTVRDASLEKYVDERKLKTFGGRTCTLKDINGLISKSLSPRPSTTFESRRLVLFCLFSVSSLSVPVLLYIYEVYFDHNLNTQRYAPINNSDTAAFTVDSSDISHKP